MAPTPTSPEGSPITVKARHRAATLALVATVGLTGFKLTAGVLSGSVGVLSEAIHSFLDLISAALSYFTVREAIKPADKEHPFGHGKIETLSSLFEALLLVVAAGLIIFEGIEHVRSPQPLQHEGIAILAILVSVIVSYLVYRHNRVAATETDSSAIRVNALHFLADVVASLGVLMGLILLKFTHWLLIDPIMAFAVAAYIVQVSFRQVLNAIRELSDTQLPEEEVAAIQRLLDGFRGKTIEAHDLRTRRSGVNRHIDFHLVACGQMTVEESHAICDEIENKILESFPGSSINIHVEPCERHKTQCYRACPVYQKRHGAEAEHEPHRMV